MSFKDVVKRRLGKSLGCVGRFEVNTAAKFAPSSAKSLESGKGVKTKSPSLVADGVVGVDEVPSNKVSVDEVIASVEVVPFLADVLSVPGALVVRSALVLCWVDVDAAVVLSANVVNPPTELLVPAGVVTTVAVVSGGEDVVAAAVELRVLLSDDVLAAVAVSGWVTFVGWVVVCETLPLVVGSAGVWVRLTSGDEVRLRGVLVDVEGGSSVELTAPVELNSSDDVTAVVLV